MKAITVKVNHISLETHIIQESAESAFMNAYWQALESGSSVLTVDNGVIVEVFPNGSYKKLKKITPLIPVTLGQKRIRHKHEQNTTTTNVCRRERFGENHAERTTE